jgi:hypothetical protein
MSAEAIAQNPSLFLAIAEISGVFVGFGALISLTRRGEIAPTTLGRIQAVVTIGLVVIVAAFLPVVLGGYGVNGHALWFWCSLVFLLLVWAVTVFSLRSSQNRRLVTSQARSNPVLAAFFWILLEAAIQVPLILTLLGIFPDVEPGFYTTALAFNLFEAAFVLAQVVFAQAAAGQSSG